MGFDQNAQPQSSTSNSSSSTNSTPGAGKAPLINAGAGGSASKRKREDGAEDTGANQSVEPQHKNQRTDRLPLDDLKEAVESGNVAAAITAYSSLDPTIRPTVINDAALMQKIIRLDADFAYTVMLDVAQPQAARLSRVSDAAPPAAILARYLQVEGITNAGQLRAVAPDLGNCKSFLTSALLDPVIRSGTAIDQLGLAIDGEAMLKVAYAGKSPLEFLSVLAADLPTIRVGMTTPAFRTWVLSKPDLIAPKITAAPERLAWARLLWASPDAAILAGWIHAARPEWGQSLASELLGTGTAADGTALAATGDAGAAAALEAIASVKQVAGLGEVLAKLAIKLAQQVAIVNALNLLDAASLPLLLNRTGVAAADQDELTRDDAVVAIVRKLAGTQRADQVLRVLAATPAAFAAAIHPERPFTLWVTQDRNNLWLTMQAVVDWPGWIAAFKALKAWALVLELAGDPAKRTVLRPHILPEWHWLMSDVQKPVGTQALAQAILELYGDGAGIALADKYLTWQALYRAQLAPAGHLLSLPWTVAATPTSPQWNMAEVYVGDAPNNDAMNLFFHQFRQLPRTHVDTANGILMGHAQRSSATNAATGQIWYKDLAGNYSSSTPVDHPLATSYFVPTNNWVVMCATGGAGTPDTSRIGDWHGSGFAVNTPGLDPLAGGTPQPMAMFQNHATHEVGHAVGNKTLNRAGFSVSGDDWTQQFGNWQQNGNANGYATMCGWQPAQDAATYSFPDPTNPAANISFPGIQIRTFLTGMVQLGKTGMAGHQVAIGLGSVDNALSTLFNDPVLGPSALVQNVAWLSTLGNMPDMSYMIAVAPVGPKVHFFCTRWGNTWVTYDAAAWHSKVSHYGVSSYKEMFAEMYTAKFTGAGLPAANNGHNPAAFFTALEQANPADLGLPAYSNNAPATPAAPSGQGQGENRNPQVAEASKATPPVITQRPPDSVGRPL